MKSILAIIVLLCAVLLVGCASEAPVAPAPEPVAPQTPPPAAPEPEPVEEVKAPESDTEEVESGLDKVFGASDEEQVITVEDILCDKETNTLTFRFRNLDDRNWQLNNKVSFPPAADLGGVRITLNSYEMNGLRRPLVAGEELFGPGWPFSENCGGVEVLGMGEEATCTVSPVKLKTSTEIAGGNNELRINGMGADGNVLFTCE
ncbi:hypothetical protein GOV11_02770 [Candidatus Woesearchaeota archaeon]|nr:hypothetical protein [Candidatus Woesearchaeota archaeon]